MKQTSSVMASWWGRRFRRDVLDDKGSVAVELGLLGGLFLAPLMLGIIQFGIYFNATQALAAATRVGAEYARQHPTDTAGIQAAITNSMNSMNSPAGTLTFPASFPLTCQCDGTTANPTAITCGNSCFTAGLPGPNRVS